MDEALARILRMVEGGRLSPDEADRLLSAVLRRSGGRSRAEPSPPTRRTCVRIRVFEGELPEPEVNVTIPLPLARVVLRWLPPEAREKLSATVGNLDELGRALADFGPAGPAAVADVRDADSHLLVTVE